MAFASERLLVVRDVLEIGMRLQTQEVVREVAQVFCKRRPHEFGDIESAASELERTVKADLKELHLLGYLGLDFHDLDGNPVSEDEAKELKTYSRIWTWIKSRTEVSGAQMLGRLGADMRAHDCLARDFEVQRAGSQFSRAHFNLIFRLGLETLNLRLPEEQANSLLILTRATSETIESLFSGRFELPGNIKRRVGLLSLPLPTLSGLSVKKKVPGHCGLQFRAEGEVDIHDFGSTNGTRYKAVSRLELAALDGFALMGGGKGKTVPLQRESKWAGLFEKGFKDVLPGKPRRLTGPNLLQLGADFQILLIPPGYE